MRGCNRILFLNILKKLADNIIPFFSLYRFKKKFKEDTIQLSTAFMPFRVDNQHWSYIYITYISFNDCCQFRTYNIIYTCLCQKWRIRINIDGVRIGRSVKFFPMRFNEWYLRTGANRSDHIFNVFVICSINKCCDSKLQRVTYFNRQLPKKARVYSYSA